MTSQNTPNKLSRRDWLRDAAIATTGAAVLPSFLTGCSDHLNPGPVKVGITDPILLKSAAENLLHMNAWIQDVYPFCIEYELAVYALLKSGEKPTNWTDFIVDIFVEMAVGVLEVSVGEIPGVGPAIAIAGAGIKQWILASERPDILDGQFAEFALGHNRMQKAISDMLLILADETDNYKNLREGFKEDVPFNGKNYSLNDLAASQFPTVSNGKEYTALRTAAFNKFQKDIWNVMLLKCANMYTESFLLFTNESPTKQAREKHYPQNPDTYLRGFWNYKILNGTTYFDNLAFYFTVDGRRLSEKACRELFMDDTPGNNINSEGLFNRDYVFKQFQRTRPDFYGYHDLRADLRYFSDDLHKNYDPSTENYEFTGGAFPQLIKK